MTHAHVGVVLESLLTDYATSHPNAVRLPVGMRSNACSGQPLPYAKRALHRALSAYPITLIAETDKEQE